MKQNSLINILLQALADVTQQRLRFSFVYYEDYRGKNARYFINMNLDDVCVLLHKTNNHVIALHLTFLIETVYPEILRNDYPHDEILAFAQIGARNQLAGKEILRTWANSISENNENREIRTLFISGLNIIA